MKRRYKKLTALFALLASVLMVLTLGLPAPADANETTEFPYSYKVRLFAGNKGKFATDGPAVYTGIPKGFRGVDLKALFDQNNGKITDDKYVLIGFRESGKDNDDQGSFIGGRGIVPYAIDFDTDFVVAYGVEAGLVPYTLRFVEYGTGKELAAPQTYYGKDGDKPVVAYEHIEGYRPLYLSITGTLHADETNEWTFEYVALAEGETFDESTMSTQTTTTEVPGTTTTTTTETTGNTTETVTTEPGNTTIVRSEVPGTTRTNYVPGTTTETVSPGPTTETNTTVTGGTGAGATGAAATTETTETPTVETPAPQTTEILDLDTPLAGPSGSNTSPSPTASAVLLNHTPIVGLAIALVLAIGLLLFFFIKRKKDEEDEEDEPAVE